MEEFEEISANSGYEKQKGNKFINVDLYEPSQIFIIYTKLGKTLLLSVNDIEKLHFLNQKTFEKDLSFSYASFTYYKDVKI